MRVDKPFPLAHEGWPFLLAGVSLAVVGVAAHTVPVMWIGVAWAVACGWFFRNPPRAIPDEAGLMVSPADGTVIDITQAVEPYFSQRPMRKMSIFLSVCNVHVNRMPIAGTVMGVRYTPGKFHIASRPAASEENERNAVWIRDGDGADIVLVQVAGKVARRIVSYAKAGDAVERGARCGIIRFGSRCDLFFPLAWTPIVHVGERVFGGSTVLGKTTGTA